MRRTVWILLFFLTAGEALASAPKIVVSIPPVHSWLASLTAGVTEPVLLLESAGDPHHMALTPSQMRALNEADIIVWVGPALESALAKPIETLDREKTTVVTLSTLKSLARDGESRAARLRDAHLWLDLSKTVKALNALYAVLREQDGNGSLTPKYAENFAALMKDIMALDENARDRLATGAPATADYIAYHDLFRYQNVAYGLNIRMILAASHEHKPGARQLNAARDLVRKEGIDCVLGDPAANLGIIENLIEGTKARHAVLDIMGREQTPGPDLYVDLMRKLAKDIALCGGGDG